MKNLRVLKFGGSSVADVEKIKHVAKIIANYKKKGFKVVVVVSAMGNTTDNLIELANKVNPHPEKRELDMLLATGEQVSSALLAMALQNLGLKAIAFSGYQVKIITDKIHTKARIITIDTKRLRKELNEDKIVVVAGFQGISAYTQDITTLGRGGSDLTAVALAYALNADLCEIYTDVEGIFTADPKIVKSARKLDFISYDEMLELASTGAQVMQTRSIEVAKKFNVKIEVKSTFSKKGGTMIGRISKEIEAPLISGISLNTKEAKITICGVPDRPGIAAKIFNEIAKENINVDMIVQNVSHKGLTDISFTVSKEDLDKAFQITQNVAKKIKAQNVLKDENIARVSVVGIGMKTQAGVAGKVFKTLAENKINIEMISTSEISISCIIKKQDAKKAVSALHKRFKLDKIKVQKK